MAPICSRTLNDMLQSTLRCICEHWYRTWKGFPANVQVYNAVHISWGDQLEAMTLYGKLLQHNWQTWSYAALYWGAYIVTAQILRLSHSSICKKDNLIAALKRNHQIILRTDIPVWVSTILQRVECG